jgi:hypothetical protein
VAAVGCQGHSENLALMTAKNAQPFSGAHIPQPKRVIGRGRDRVAAVGRNYHGKHFAVVPREDTLVSSVQVPRPKRLIGGRRYRVPSIGCDRHSEDLTRMAPKVT